jgi:hypothetical protein
MWAPDDSSLFACDAVLLGKQFIMFQTTASHLIFMGPCTVIWLSKNTNNMQLVTEFIIPKFIEGSSCFEQHTTHHQEL